MRVATISELTQLKHSAGLGDVTLKTGPLKRRNLLRHGVRYGLFALREGGVLKIEDDGPVGFDLTPGPVPFSIVRQQAFKLARDEAECVALDEAAMTLTLRRTRPPQSRTFGAGIIVSGKKEELPAIRAALAGLRAQPELHPKAGGGLYLCGPPSAAHLFAEDDITYVPFKDPPGPRAFTTRKKNALIDAMTQDKCVILHARIVLSDGCLSRLPAEFDAITPRVEYHEAGTVVPYLDWTLAPILDGEGLVRSLTLPFDYDRSTYLSKLRQPGRPTIDGGVFIVRRTLAREVPLNPHLAWGEAEDTEWCARLHHAGALVDLEPSALALSQSLKFPRRYLDQPGYVRATQPARRAFKHLGRFR